MEEQFNRIMDFLMEFQEKIIAFQERLEAGFNKMDRRLDSIEKNTSETRINVDAIKKINTVKEDFKAKSFELSGEVRSLATKVDEMFFDTYETKSTASGNEAEIAALKERVKRLEEKIARLEVT